jgi:Ca-activated chloride channel family protein
MIAWLEGVGFREPRWLLLVPVVVGVYYLFVRIRPSRGKRLAAYADRHLLEWLILGPQTVPSRSWLIPLAWCLIALAVSGPYLKDPQARQFHPGLHIALVIDISPSMAASDVQPDRLRRARLEARDFLQRSTGDSVSLIAFSASAYRVLPPTTDLPLVSTYVDALDPGLTRLKGSNLIQALELAAQTLATAPKHARAIVVLSDGETPDKTEIAKVADRLAREDIPVFALGIGTEAGAPVPGPNGYLHHPNGEPVVSHLDRATLQRLADRSGGLYADARIDDTDWDRLFAGLNRLERDRLATQGATAGYALFPWILAVCLLVILWTHHPRVAPAAVLVLVAPAMLIGFPEAARAAPSERAAYEALTTGHYDEAARLYAFIDSYDGWLGRGAAAYRMGKWAQALASFKEAEHRASDDERRARALYDQANALARMQRLEEALMALDRALELFPNDSRAALNRELISRALHERELSMQSEDKSDRRAPEAAIRQAGDPSREKGVRASNARGARIDGESGSRSASNPGGPEGRAEPGDREVAAGSTPAHTVPGSAAAALGALDDDPSEVLRHRFMVIDAARSGAAEDQPW